MRGWVFYAILASILVGCLLLLCCVVRCTQDCFYPEGTRGPKVRTFNDGNEDRYLGPDGPSWKKKQLPPPQEVYRP